VAAGARRSENDPEVNRAYRALRAAAKAYDDALYVEHDEVTPFELPDPVEAEEDAGEELDPYRFTVLARWDFTVTDPRALNLATNEEAGSPAEALAMLAADRGHSALGDPDAGLAVGLRWHGATTWVLGTVDAVGDDATWMDDAFAEADPDEVLCRFDVPVRWAQPQV
jgi:FAD/FMN-containing dehydrogenase